MIELYVMFAGILILLDLRHLSQIVTNVVVQIIILLYLIDNNEQTSWMILMGSGVSVAIEAWKVRSLTVLTRTVHVCGFLGKMR